MGSAQGANLLLDSVVGDAQNSVPALGLPRQTFVTLKALSQALSITLAAEASISSTTDAFKSIGDLQPMAETKEESAGWPDSINLVSPDKPVSVLQSAAVAGEVQHQLQVQVSTAGKSSMDLTMDHLEAVPQVSTCFCYKRMFQSAHALQRVIPCCSLHLY